MFVFLEHFPCATPSIVLNKYKYKNRKHMHIRYPNSMCPDNHANIQPSSKDGVKKIYVPIENNIDIYITNPDHTNSLWIMHHKKMLRNKKNTLILH